MKMTRAAKTLSLIFTALVCLGAACSSRPTPSGVVHDDGAEASAREGDHGEGTSAAEAPPEGRRVAIFAGGCFWCMEGPFEAIDGVDSVLSGYTGGPEEHPTYHQVGYGRTGHVEAVHIVYDPTRVTYAQLLEVFWHNVDPTQDDGQFCDRGAQYRTGIFVANDEERAAAQQSLEAVARQLGRPVVTRIRDASTFWVAEAYHQDFYRTNPAHYTRYRRGCGRDRRLRQLWGDAAAH